MGYPSVVGRPSPIGLRMRQVLEQRGRLPSGAPGTDAKSAQIVRWLLDNLYHEEAVLHMEQKLMPLWEKKGMGGTTAAKTGEVLNRALDALSAPLQEPRCPGSWGGQGGGGEHLTEEDAGAALLHHLAHGSARPPAPAPPSTSRSQTTSRTPHGFEKAATGSMDTTIGSSSASPQHRIPLSMDGRGLITGGGPSQDPAMERGGRPRPPSTAPLVPPRSATPLASPPPAATADIEHLIADETAAKPLSLMSRAELGVLCRDRGLPLGDSDFMLKVLSMPAAEAKEVRATWARQLAAMQDKWVNQQVMSAVPTRG
ncbi:hypothetical protein T484DRAFT_1889601 [Baffinella frigidus]|nr:hypothetical protein T484DRAFT_1889601 [Cryptophyta sp. CCMP2293]